MRRAGRGPELCRRLGKSEFLEAEARGGAE